MTRRCLLTLLIAGCLAPGLVRAEDAVFDSNGVKIRYVTEGAGEAVVLIHGWMADSGMWGRDASGRTKLSTKNTDGFRLIALDCRGHGQSDKPHDPAAYGPEMAADVVRLLDHLKIEKAHLVGYSSGAFIAGKVAATHPKRVLSVIYAGQAPLVAGTNAPGSSEVDVFAKAVDEGQDLGSYIIAVTPSGRHKPTEDQAKAMAKFMFGGKDVKAFAAAGRSFGNLEVTRKQLKKCKAPVLFIHGDADGWAAMNSVKCWEQLRRMGIQSDLHTLVGRGHCFQRKAAPGTGSYTWMGRIWEFMNHKGFNK